ncbi:MAG TPA: hypothetical protein VGP26_24565 [Actinophytocola sp.]|jgi:hypothetical protein|nr:hypothetical protein [Actinophytocola sp.]
MALLVCTNDGVLHSVGSEACPQCGCTERVEQGSPEHEALLAARGERVPGDGDASAGGDVGDDVPDATVDEVMAWVGEDGARALRALTKEQAAARPRLSLVNQLGELVDEAGS